MILFSLCDINLPILLLLGWLLPFLLGWLLGRLRKEDDNQNDDLDSCIIAKNELSNRVNSLQDDLDACKRARLDLDNQVNLLNIDIKNTQSKYDSLSIRSATVVASTTKKSSMSASSSMFATLSPNNLQVVEGVGPKMNELLNKGDINNWSDLAKSNPTALRAILDKYGNKYRMIDPTTWPEQATMANDDNWENLISYQKNLSTGITSTTHQTDSKVEKILIKSGALRKFKLDDLKAIEGIGPKIAGLLINAGINTWHQLSEAKIDVLASILDAAGKRYALADPGTWSQQASLAAEKKWDKLRELQDQLKGGRDV